MWEGPNLSRVTWQGPVGAMCDDVGRLGGVTCDVAKSKTVLVVAVCDMARSGWVVCDVAMTWQSPVGVECVYGHGWQWSEVASSDWLGELRCVCVCVCERERQRHRQRARRGCDNSVKNKEQKREKKQKQKEKEKENKKLHCSLILSFFLTLFYFFSFLSQVPF